VLVTPGRAKEFREAALRVMKANGIEINDLHGTMLPVLTARLTFLTAVVKSELDFTVWQRLLQSCLAGIGDLSAAEVKLLKIRQSSQMLQASVSDS